MKYKLIDAEKADIPVDRMCDFLGVATSGYYAWKSRAPSRRQLDDMIYLAHIPALFSQSNGTYGSPRMYVDLKEEGLRIGRHRTARLMRENGLKARQKTRLNARLTAAITVPLPAILLIRISPVTAQIRNGVSISATSGQPKAGSI